MVRVIVIGGGATGAGVLLDLAQRGIPALLVEQGDLVSGTSGRYHGLLHSGGRYAVKDPESARECCAENAIVRRIAPWAVEQCGGLFVQLRDDDPTYAGRWVEACRTAGIPAEPVDLTELRRQEPELSPSAVAAYRVPDASVDGFRLITAAVAAAGRLGAQVLTYRRVEGLLTGPTGVTGVRLRNLATGEVEQLEAELVINAAGAWADRIAAMAGIHLDMVADRGALAVFHGRLTSRVVNRLRPPGNGDIFVPAGSVTLLGTTAVPVSGPEELTIPPDEVESLLRLGAELIPAAASARVLRLFAGVRPLLGNGVEGGTRNLSRTFRVMEHESEHGVPGLVSVLGGKLTTFRLMAEKTVDVAAAKLGVSAPCRTADDPILPPPDPATTRPVISLAGPALAHGILDRQPAYLADVARELSRPLGRQVVCDCEQVTAGELVAVARRLTNPNLSDLRRRTRLGMGTCQGTFCGYRAVLALTREGVSPPDVAMDMLLEFQAERWGGVRGALPEQGLQGAELAYGLAASLLPASPPVGSGPKPDPAPRSNGGDSRE